MGIASSVLRDWQHESGVAQEVNPLRMFVAWLMLILAFASLQACGPTSTTTAPTQSPKVETTTSSTATLVPSSTSLSTEPPPTAPPTPTFTPVEGPIGDLILGFHQVAVKYEVASWVAGVAENGGALLVHRAIPHCSLREQGATESPPIQQAVTIGQILYDVNETEGLADGELVRWYLAKDGFENPIRGNIPILIVSADLQDPVSCLDAAHQVLSTLFNPASS